MNFVAAAIQHASQETFGQGVVVQHVTCATSLGIMLAWIAAVSQTAAISLVSVTRRVNPKVLATMGVVE